MSMLANRTVELPDVIEVHALMTRGEKRRAKVFLNSPDYDALVHITDENGIIKGYGIEIPESSNEALFALVPETGIGTFCVAAVGLAGFLGGIFVGLLVGLAF